jgi:hypothetical protein
MKNQREPIVTDEDIDPDQTHIDDSEMDLFYPKIRIRIGLIFAVSGYILFLLGARPGLFGLDRSRVIGFVQISVFLIGLAAITLGSYLTLNALWPNGKKTIAADIGSRLISTGYVICVFTAMADIFGLGSHPLPNVVFGPLQARGMEIGMATIAIGFLLLIRYKRNNNNHQQPENNGQPPENKKRKAFSPKPDDSSNRIALVNFP